MRSFEWPTIWCELRISMINADHHLFEGSTAAAGPATDLGAFAAVERNKKLPASRPIIKRFPTGDVWDLYREIGSIPNIEFP